MTVALVCPIHREPLIGQEPGWLVGLGHGQRYPVVNGVPILLSDEAERKRVAQPDRPQARPGDGSPVDYYNAPDAGERCGRASLEAIRDDVQRWLPARRCDGPTTMRFGRRRPSYGTRWGSDADAVARLDAHEGCLYFHARRYEVLAPGASAGRQLMARNEPVVVRKPAASPTSPTSSASSTAPGEHVA